MTPKERAQDLVNKFIDNSVVHEDGEYFYHPKPFCLAKQCALKAVDEILSTIVSTPTDYGASWTYWEQVKKEIQKL
jgi:hypothetical protein